MKHPLEIWNDKLKKLAKRGLDERFVKVFDIVGPGRWEGVVRELLLLPAEDLRKLNTVFYQKRGEA